MSSLMIGVLDLGLHNSRERVYSQMNRTQGAKLCEAFDKTICRALECNVIHLALFQSDVFL
jgi:hypothetical protein